MVDWEVNKVKLSELKDFIASRPFSPHSVIPISPTRVLSYIKNPKASPSDIVLYYIEKDTEIIAFRTVWADTVMVEGKPTKFGWCSGNWVSTKYRRQGLSGHLLKAMFTDWNGKLMFTNYAPESEAGYLKTNLFTTKLLRNGIRFYFNANLIELFVHRSKSFVKKTVISLVNVLYRWVYHFKRVLFFPYSFKGYNVEIEKTYSNQFFFENQLSVFGRNTTDFLWIFDYPWLENGEEKKENYPFSWKTNGFEYSFISLKKEDEPICSFIISNREGAVKLLYWNSRSESKELIAKWIANYCHRFIVKTMTIIDHELAMAVKKTRNPFVASKGFTMNIYSTFEFDSANRKIFDGDGDYIFT